MIDDNRLDRMLDAFEVPPLPPSFGIHTADAALRRIRNGESQPARAGLAPWFAWPALGALTVMSALVLLAVNVKDAADPVAGFADQYVRMAAAAEAEDKAAEEIIGLFDVAANDPAPAIDDFLDSVLPAEGDDPDIWDYFMDQG